jgi:hypothetical protein
LHIYNECGYRIVEDVATEIEVAGILIWDLVLFGRVIYFQMELAAYLNIPNLVPGTTVPMKCLESCYS